MCLLHMAFLGLKCVLFETTKKGLLNSPKIYEHPFTERPGIYVCFLTPTQPLIYRHGRSGVNTCNF